MPKRRIRRHALAWRLWRHHLPLAAASAAATLAIHDGADGADVRRWSVATAWVGLALLTATLVIGPLRVLGGRRTGVSNDLRRDTGIWAAAAGLAHVFFGLQVHLGGQLSKYFLSVSKFGAANWLGLAATAVLALLLSLSNDRSLTWLGSRRWKSLQRLSYWLFGLTLLHTVLYLDSEARTRLLLPLTVLTALGVTAVQLAGLRRRRASASPTDA